MLLTKKTPARTSAGAHDVTAQGAATSPFIHSLRRGLSNALPTMDRRAFLRWSVLFF
jgi:formate dehydrogenase major subunit